jgi:hypothetical protein
MTNYIGERASRCGEWIDRMLNRAARWWQSPQLLARELAARLWASVLELVRIRPPYSEQTLMQKPTQLFLSLRDAVIFVLPLLEGSVD